MASVEDNADSSTWASLGLRGSTCLFVASTGGHLAELMRVIRVIEPSRDSVIVTFDSPQSRSLAQHYRVEFVPYVKPRDIRGVVGATSRISALRRQHNWDAVISTGAGVALSALPTAALRGVRSVYIESYSRFDGPSMTGRVLSRVSPRVELYTQHRSWAGGRWTYSGSVLDSLTPTRVPPDASRGAHVFVTLGTIKPYRFDLLVDRVLAVAPPETQFTWQLGSTTRKDLPGGVHEFLSHEQFLEEVARATVVVSHAGVGTAMDLIEAGQIPLLVPRRASRQEHVDDHQAQIVRDLVGRGLAVGREALDITTADLQTR